MKIRIQGNTIRLRLTQPEIVCLGSKGLVEQSTDFDNHSIFKYSISFSLSANEPEAGFSNGHINITIPEYTRKSWIDTNKTGIENEEYTNQGPGLKILVEKDFQCLHERKNEDESEAFPNPMSPSSAG